MEIIETYDTWPDRQAFVALHQGNGLQMYHDEVRGGIKTLVFNDPKDDTAALNLQELKAEMVSQAAVKLMMSTGLNGNELRLLGIRF